MAESRLWGELTWEQIAEAAEARAIVVAPFGSVEQHGPQLPVDTDVRIAEKTATEGAALAAERFGVDSLVLPTMPFGLAQHHLAFAGTVTLSPETYLTVVAEVLGSVVRHGFRRIGVISGHGGNEPGLRLGIEKAVYAAPGPVRIARYRGWQDPEFTRLREAIYADLPAETMGIHAARTETSETLADRPHLVRRERLLRPELKRTSVPEWRWRTEELSPTGAFGDPTLATAELGARLWAAQAEAIARFIKRLADEPDPDDLEG